MCGRARCVLPTNDIQSAIRRKAKSQQLPAHVVSFKFCHANASHGHGDSEPYKYKFAKDSQRVQQWDSEQHRSIGENISPGMDLPVVMLATTGGQDASATGDSALPLSIEMMTWGLIPSAFGAGRSSEATSFPAADFYKMFNARIETILELPSFRRLVHKRRAVVALSGFYEWKAVDNSASSSAHRGKKTPYYISDAAGEPLLLAVLVDETAGGLKTFTMLTCDANPQISWLHNRQPVFLTFGEQVARWLDVSNVRAEDILNELTSNRYNPTDITISTREVSPRMTNAKYHENDCAEPVQTVATSTCKISQRSIDDFFTKSVKKTSKSETKSPMPSMDALVNSQCPQLKPPICTSSDSDTTIVCPMCSRDISSQSLFERERHVGGCLQTMATVNHSGEQPSRLDSKRPRIFYDLTADDTISDEVDNVS